MATPTIGLLNQTEINDADTTTGWVEFTSLDADLVKEGNYSLGGILRADGDTGYYDAGSAPVTAAGKTVRLWFNTINLPFMEVEANGGYEFFMYDGSTTEYLTVFGADTYFGGWVNIILDCDQFTTLTLANVQRWGIRANHASNAANKTNCWIDIIRYMDGYYVTGGTSGDPILLTNIATADRGTTPLYGYGIMTEIEGLFICTGTFQIGNGATTTYFSMNGAVLYYADRPIAAGLYTFEGNGSGADISIVNSVIGSSGTTDATRFVLDMVTGSPGSVTMTGCVIRRAGAVSFTSGQAITGCTFIDCGQIDADGADISGSAVTGYEGTSDSAALVWDVATDPNNYLAGMSFEKGTASTHAIEFGTSAPTSMTLTGIDFSGYNASNGQTDSTFYVAATGGTVTINLSSCTGNATYKSAGATVTIVNSKTATFTPIENGSAFTITRNSDNAVLEDVSSVTGGEVIYSYDGSLDGTATTVHLIIAGKEPIDFPWTIAEGTIPIAQITDRVYSNP